ncbi:unnamed protein product [Dibothriocephalus latus]|uniref:SCP domain-containing protein n=1 Tax=Dibothriocephalus latus TaxID=60516 RepID=A0A3P6UWX9_DIBLA|nr:unnamed protein product [Dibothriocephalus latus]
MGVDIKFNEEAINAHNAYFDHFANYAIVGSPPCSFSCLCAACSLRSLHGCAPLAYDAELAQQAQSYAETLAQKNMMVHSHLPGVGENLATRSSTGPADLSATDTSLMWYKEILDYQFTGKDQIACGHFSQVVWKDTKFAGFGVAKTADGHGVFVVGQYNPPGNFMGQWGSQVPVPINGLIVVPTADELMRKSIYQNRGLPLFSVKNTRYLPKLSSM